MTLLRPATEADLPGIFEIYDREVLQGTATCDTELKTAPERLAFLQAHASPEYPLLVAPEGPSGEIAAWGCLSPWSPRKAYAPTCEDTVYVRPASQGRGLGRLVLNELIARARADGRALVIARIVVGNPASMRLHASLGFETLGLMPGAAVKFGRVLDVAILGLRLPAGRPC